MDISIITVNTNDGAFILQQIKSVQEGVRDLSFEQIVSDNGSTDGSVAAIKEQFPHVKIVENGKNVGFGAANNRAYELSQGRYILFLNPDMVVFPGMLSQWVDWMDIYPYVAISGCKLVDKQGRVNQDALPRRFPRLLEQLSILLKLNHLFPRLLQGYLMQDMDTEKEQKVDSVRGSCMMVRRTFIEELGLPFDPRYFIWFEDVDLCKEASKRGYCVMYVPGVSCMDHVGKTFQRQAVFIKQCWFTKSMLQYFKKWTPWYTWMWIAFLRPGVIFGAWLYEVVGRKVIR